MPKTILGTDKIICPFCNHYHNDIQEYISPEDYKGKFNMECENEKCGVTFDVEFKTETTFRSIKK